MSCDLLISIESIGEHMIDRYGMIWIDRLRIPLIGVRRVAQRNQTAEKPADITAGDGARRGRS